MIDKLFLLLALRLPENIDLNLSGPNNRSGFLYAYNSSSQVQVARGSRLLYGENLVNVCAILGFRDAFPLYKLIEIPLIQNEVVYRPYLCKRGCRDRYLVCRECYGLYLECQTSPFRLSLTGDVQVNFETDWSVACFAFSPSINSDPATCRNLGLSLNIKSYQLLSRCISEFPCVKSEVLIESTCSGLEFKALRCNNTSILELNPSAVTTGTSLKFVYLNVCGITHKLNLVSTQLTESHPTSNIDNTLISIYGFEEPIRCDRDRAYIVKGTMKLNPSTVTTGTVEPKPTAVTTGTMNKDVHFSRYKHFPLRFADETGGLITGTVEINIYGVWGRICDDDITDNDVQVICNQLGIDWDIPGSRRSYSRNWSEGVKKWKLSTNCSGYESRLSACGNMLLQEEYCGGSLTILCAIDSKPDSGVSVSALTIYYVLGGTYLCWILVCLACFLAVCDKQRRNKLVNTNENVTLQTTTSSELSSLNQPSRSTSPLSSQQIVAPVNNAYDNMPPMLGLPTYHGDMTSPNEPPYYDEIILSDNLPSYDDLFPNGEPTITETEAL